MDEEAREVVVRTAKERKAPLILASELVSIQRLSHDEGGQKLKIETSGNSYRPVTIPLAGKFQVENLATAVAVLEVLADRSLVDIDEPALLNGLSGVEWPGRCEVLSRDPLMVLDVAHNPSGARALAATLEEIAGGRKIGLVLSLLKDKDCKAIVSEFAPVISRSWVVQLHTSRSMDLGALEACVRGGGIPVTGCTLAEAVRDAREWAMENDGVVCMSGSLYLAGEVMRLVEANRFES